MGVNYSCCNSCHEDEEDGYSSLRERDFQNQEFEICCKGASKIDKIDRLKGGEAAKNRG